MEPTPPRRPKPQDLAFYETPDHVTTSSKIINDARSSLRSLRTRRPQTPRQEERTLFDRTVSGRDPTKRPPSAFSLDSRHFDRSIESRPISGGKLAPLNHVPKTPPKTPPDFYEKSPTLPKPPPDPNRPVRKRPSRTKLLQHSTSVDGSTQEISLRKKSGSLQDVSTVDKESPEPAIDLTRRVHSGPKERTENLLEERGVGDGSECVHRPPSSVPRSPEKSPVKEPRKESGYGSERGSSAGSRVSSGGRMGSSGEREKETPAEAEYYNLHVLPITEELTGELLADKDSGKLCKLCSQLYTALQEGKMLGRACKRRSSILKIIFKLLDVAEPRLMLRCAKLILSLKVTGRNLESVCKLVFKVCKIESNDTLFMEEDVMGIIIETVCSIDLSTSRQALIYLLGALRFICGNKTIAQNAVELGFVEALCDLLKAANEVVLKSGRSEDLADVLIQLTGSLRILAENENKEKFLAGNVFEELGTVMEHYMSELEMMQYIARFLSKLTVSTDICNAVNRLPSIYTSFLNLLTTYMDKEALVVRITFVLGNLTAKSDDARANLFAVPGAIEILMKVFKTYFELDLKQTSNPQPEESKPKDNEPGKIEDILIKVIRVIANLSINEDIGPVLATNRTCVDLLIHIIENKSITSSEELVLNAVATINNFSYYDEKKCSVKEKQLDVASALLKLLTPAHIDGLIEACRVYGNLTRQKQVRDFIAENKGTEMMIALLDSGSREVVYTACGVLINLMADENKRSLLKTEGGVQKLIEVLRDFGRNDWHLASMVCQILWNYSSKITSSSDTYGEHESQELSDLLVEYLDEENASDNSLSAGLDGEMREYLMDMWMSEFKPVATQLLKRLEKHQSNFEPL